MKTNEELILLTINGADRPGVTAALTEILAQHNAIILDIGQADIHNNLSLGILFQSDASTSGNILKEVLFRSYELGVNVRFKPIAETEYSEWGEYAGTQSLHRDHPEPEAHGQTDSRSEPYHRRARDGI